MKEIIYSPKSIPNGIIPLIKSIIKDFYDGRHLGKQLFVRDLKAQYRQSFLGFFWAFAPTVVTALLWIFLNSSKVIQVDVKGMSYPIFTIVGTFIWQILTQSLFNTMNCVSNGKSLLTKLNFPRESLLIHAIYTTLFNASILFLVTVLISFILGLQFSLGLLLFPFVMIDLMIVGMSLGLLFHSIFSMIADFSKMITMALPFLMYVSAVIFPKPTKGNFANIIFSINPFTHLVNFSREVFTGMPIDCTLAFVVVSAVSLILLFVGLIMYKITMPIIIERLGS